MKKLMLTDGNSMLFRAYYATAYGKRMTTSKGVPTNAVFAFLNMLQKAMDQEKPDAIFVAFDAGKHTFRHDLYPEYKGTRKPAPDDLVPQFSLVRDLLTAYGICWKEMPDIEADDLIGTMSKKYPDFDTVVFTSDHDMLQLVDDTTSVLLMKKGISDMDVITPSKMKEEMGIEPLQIVDLKGLMGDTSDNIPGIKGIGEKTALKLLQEYGSVENVLAHTDELKGAIKKKVEEGHDLALLSKDLATIRRNIEVDVKIEDCLFHPDYASLVKFLLSLDMKTLASRYAAMIEVDGEAKKGFTPERVKSLEASFFAKPYAVFVDDEPVSFMDASVHGIAFANEDRTVYMDLEDVKACETIMGEMAKKTGIGYDIKRNLHVLSRAGISADFADDVMIMASLADSEMTDMKKIIAKYGLIADVKYEDVYGKANHPVLLVDEQKQAEYGCRNAADILEIYKANADDITKFDLNKLYRDVELPLTYILRDMEADGIRCDETILNTISESTLERIHSIQSIIYELAGKEFNINSPKQLAEVLYDDLGLYGGKKRSTSADVLEKYVDIPIVREILEYRRLSKIYSTYAEGLKKYIKKDGRIHTVYNQAATTTGRLSSSEPNLQNISVRDEEGKMIRKAFLPDEGCVLISCDYHQIELRMLAHMANETALLQAFNEGIDIHTKTAMDVFGVSKEDVTPLMRRQAKTVNFGIVYGISDFGLAKQLGVSNAQAKEFIDTYYEKYPRIHTYMHSVIEDCEKNGYVTTLLGRRREIPEIHDKNHMIREFGKRAAMNAPIQGSAADLIKLAMIDAHKMLNEKGVRSRMILQVHDELIFNVPVDEINLMKTLINEAMVNAMKLNVPLTTDLSVGNDWYEAK